jgi:hypothetical protein
MHKKCVCVCVYRYHSRRHLHQGLFDDVDGLFMYIRVYICLYILVPLCMCKYVCVSVRTGATAGGVSFKDGVMTLMA